MGLTRIRIAVGSIVLVGAIALGVSVMPFWGSGENRIGHGTVSPERPANTAFPVRTVAARLGVLVKHLSASGTIRAGRDMDVQTRVAGYLTEVSAFNGKAVWRGDRLAAVDDRECRVAFERARADLLNAQIEFRTLSATPFLAATDSAAARQLIMSESRSLDSLREAHRRGRMGDENYERLTREREAVLAYLTANRGDVIAGRSGLAGAREAFETARLNLQWTSIAAPFNGYVADCSLSPGMHVTAGQSLMRLIDLSTLLVDVEVLEYEISRVEVGQHARIRPVGFQEKEFSGTVLHLNPIVDSRAKTMKVTIALRNGRAKGSPASVRLRPGMFASVLIETDVLAHRLLVPRSALLIRDQRPLVFTIENGLAKWHYVETGDSNEEMIEILSGLAAGDSVVIDGHYTLAHDTPVSLVNRLP